MIRKLLNPNANADNSLKLLKSQSGCCGDVGEVCKYTFSDESAIVVRGIKTLEDGTEVATLLADVPGGADMKAEYDALGTNAAKVSYLQKTIFPALFKAAGYIIEKKSDIQIASDLKSIILIGEADVSAIVNDPSTDITPDEVACTRITICDYATNFAGGADPFDVTIDGTDYTITPDTTFNYPDDLSDLQAKLTAGLTGVVLDVVAEDDTANEAFKITITNPSGQSVLIAGSAAECCDVRADFKV